LSRTIVDRFEVERGAFLSITDEREENQAPVTNSHASTITLSRITSSPISLLPRDAAGAHVSAYQKKSSGS
jgi:hypothetical protein